MELCQNNHFIAAVGGFHICHSHMVAPRGGEIEAIQDHPIYTQAIKDEVNGYVRKYYVRQCSTEHGIKNEPL